MNNERDFFSPRLELSPLPSRRRRRRFWLPFLVAGVLVLFGSVHSKSDGSSRRPPPAGAVVEQPDRPEPFASIEGTGLMMVLPAAKGEVAGVGYHQAYNLKAFPLSPATASLGQATTEAVLRVLASGRLPSFIMKSRGRGSPPSSSVDVAFVNDGTVVKSPINGTVAAVKPYLLYGRINDVRVEIKPDGCDDVKVAIIHIDKPMVEAGQKVTAGETPLAVVRKLDIDSQIDEYLGRAMAHVHIQVNPIEAGATETAAQRPR